MKRFIINCITLIRVPVILMLAIFVGTDEPVLALTLFGIGLLSHALDGPVAKWFGLRRRYSGTWHMLDTAVLSLGLQLGAVVWLLKTVSFAWWAILILTLYLIAVGVIQVLYIDNHVAEGEPFFPIILYGSAVVWVVLSFLIGCQVSTLTGFLSAIATCLLGIAHNFLHLEQWRKWDKEAEGGYVR